MRFGLLADDYIKSTNPAFFHESKHRRKQKYRVKNSVLPFYDLYSVAQVTLQNPYDIF